ncbi:MAG: hypothetical protein KKE71_05540 [Nanoarchaeota archaeon]|nr:hypothetical protein [Nanoarchaeota archaeon]
MGVSLACFFAVYWMKHGKKPKTRQREAIYAPRDEVLQYKTRKTEAEYVTAAPNSFEETKPVARNVAPTYSAPGARPFEPAEKDDFVEYAASVMTEEITNVAPNNAELEENKPKDDSEDEEFDENGDKKQKFSALRFFNS